MTLASLCAATAAPVSGSLKVTLLGIAEQCFIPAGDEEAWMSLAKYCHEPITSVIGHAQQLLRLGLLIPKEHEGRFCFFVCQEDVDYVTEGMQVVGRGPDPKRLRILERDGYACTYCNADLTYNNMTIDHVVPRCQGGGDEYTNLVACCASCNSSKGGRTPEQWRAAK
jgi:hypothetical protein